jgi:hypothetical protein
MSSATKIEEVSISLIQDFVLVHCFVERETKGGLIRSNDARHYFLVLRRILVDLYVS